MKKPIDSNYLLKTLKSFFTEVLEKRYLHNDDSSLHSHDNIETLDKIRESDNGTLIFNEKEISIEGRSGKSAYDIAVDNGFTGTEAEWLDSLKGDKGEAGEKGAKGDPGETINITFSATEPTSVPAGEIIMVYEE